MVKFLYSIYKRFTMLWYFLISWYLIIGIVLTTGIDKTKSPLWGLLIVIFLWPIRIWAEF